jgi:Tol biopolymer transport system component
MNMIRWLFFISMLICFGIPKSFSQKKEQTLSWNIDAPGKLPSLFAEGVVSDEYGNRDMAISPNGDELFYTLQYQGGRGFSTILHSIKRDGKWTKPEVAAFAGIYNDLEPAFSPDGTRLYFVSNRPYGEQMTVKDYDIWYTERKNGVWAQAVPLPAPVNTDKDEFYPSITKSGNVYFTRNMGSSDEDIVMCRFIDNRFDTAIKLPSAINSNGAEFNAFVDPDEKYILYTGYDRPGNTGAGDIFVSFKNSKGEWVESKNIGTDVNGPGLTYCPYVSPDKKYFFFTSSRGFKKPPFSKAQHLEAFKNLMKKTLNGWDNIYWMEIPEILKGR